MKNVLATIKANSTKAAVMAVPTLAMLTSTAFAAETPLPTIAITQDMLKPLVEGVVANIGVVLPIGLALFAISLGIRIIPGLISRFLHM